MKKIMFAAAALAAGVAMADAGLVSSDIVGYAQTALQSGATMLTPQFLNVANSNAMPLEKLVPVGESVDADGGISIQTLDAGGVTVDMYQWINWPADGIVGWCDDEWNVVSGVTFAPGAGLWVTGTGSGAAIQSAGAVGTADVQVQLRSGATATGIPYPTTVALQDIVPAGDSVNTDGGITIQTLDAGGVTVDMYQWINWPADGIVGWCDDDWNVVDGVTFAAGQGLWVTGDSSGAYLRFPAPELN